MLVLHLTNNANLLTHIAAWHDLSVFKNAAAFFLSEFFAMFLLIVVGNGSVGAYEMKFAKGKPKHSGLPNFTYVAIGFGFAAFMGLMSSGYSSHQMNPAVSLYEAFLQLCGEHTIYEGQLWGFFIAVAAQLLGAMLGQILIYGVFWILMHDGDPESFICMASTTRPKSDKMKKSHTYWIGALVETGSTVCVILALTLPKTLEALTGSKTGASDTFSNIIAFSAVAAVVVAVTIMSFGAVCGPGFNPARDLGPRIVYTILPLPNKEQKYAEWDYAAIPTLCPFLGAIIAACITLAVSHI